MLVNGHVEAVSVKFTGPNTGLITLPNSSTIPITRHRLWGVVIYLSPNHRELQKTTMNPESRGADEFGVARPRSSGFATTSIARLVSGAILGCLFSIAILAGVAAHAAGTRISAGIECTKALKDDGTVWAWGSNGFGCFGAGSSLDSNSSVPVQVRGISGVTALSSALHVVALKSDGTAWTWGSNESGELGDPATALGTRRTAPAPVLGMNRVVAVAAGWGRSFALKDDGSVWGWGAQPVGDGSTVDRREPVRVSSVMGMPRITALSASQTHILALAVDGTVWGWGQDSSGELSQGTPTNNNYLVPIRLKGISDVVAIAAMPADCAALLDTLA